MRSASSRARSASSARGTTLFTSPRRQASCGVELLGGEQEFLGLADPELPWLDEQLDRRTATCAAPDWRSGVVGRHDQVAHAREHQAGGHALALDGGDGGLAEVVDAPAALHVHDLLVAELALGRGAHRDPLVGVPPPTIALRSCPALKCLPAPASITTRTSSSASARSKARVDAVDEGGVLGVGHLGPVHGDGGDGPVDLVAHDRLIGCHGPPPSPVPSRSQRPPARGAGREPARRPRCAGSRSSRRRSTPPDSRARTAATTRPPGCPVAPCHSGDAGPSTSMASACSRLLISLQYSFRMLPSGPGLEPTLELRQRAPVVQLEQPDLDVGLGQAPPQPGVVEGPGVGRQAQQLLEVLQVDDELPRVHPPLVRQCRAGHPPAVALGSRPTWSSGTKTSSKVDLVELGFAGELHERADLDPGGVHVDHEERQALVLGGVGVAAGQAHAPSRRIGRTTSTPCAR